MIMFPPRRSAKAASLAVVSLGMFTVVGCTSSDTQHAQGDPKNPQAVTASNVTHIAEQDRKNVLNFPTGDAATSLVQVEQVSPQEVMVGRDYAYDVKITNLTDKPLQNVMVRSSKPDGFKTASAPDGGAAVQTTPDGALAFAVGALAAHETTVYHVSGTPSPNGNISANYSVTVQQQMATAIPVTTPALAATKTGPSELDICQPLDWSYDVKNTGTAIIRNVALQDNLPQGLATIDGAQAVNVKLGDIPPGEDRTVVAHLKASQAGKFATAATVTSDIGSFQSNAITTLTHQPRLEIDVTGPEQEYLGKQVTYEYTLTNKGDAVADASTFSINGSAGAKLIGVMEKNNGAKIDVAAGGPAAAVGAIAPGQSVTIDAMFELTAGGVLKADAVAAAKCASPVNKSIETKILTLPALLLEASDAVDPVKVGDNVVYNIKVTNQGTGPDTHVAVTATLPDGEQFVSAKGDTEANAAGSTITFAPIATLQPKQAMSWQVTAKAAKAGDVQFKVTAVSDSVKAGAEKVEPTKLY